MCHHQHGRWQKFILLVAHAPPTYTVISFSQVLIAAPTCNSAQGFTPWPAKERLNSTSLLNPRISKSVSLPGWYPNYLNDPHIFLQVGAERPRPCIGEEQIFCRWFGVWCGGDELSCPVLLICVGTGCAASTGEMWCSFTQRPRIHLQVPRLLSVGWCFPTAATVGFKSHKSLWPFSLGLKAFLRQAHLTQCSAHGLNFSQGFKGLHADPVIQ